NRAEGTFARLRYILGGDRPSQTTHQMLFPPRITAAGEKPRTRRVVSHGWLHQRCRAGFKASHLSWTTCPELQHLAVVKVHGVFPSNHGYSASSPRLQFHRIPRRDSAQVVTPFVQVGTYPTRNFALVLFGHPFRTFRT